MRTTAKKYNTNYKKKIDVFHDTFLPRRSPGEIIQCTGCGAFYHPLPFPVDRVEDQRLTAGLEAASVLFKGEVKSDWLPTDFS